MMAAVQDRNEDDDARDILQRLALAVLHQPSRAERESCGLLAALGDL